MGRLCMCMCVCVVDFSLKKNQIIDIHNKETKMNCL